MGQQEADSGGQSRPNEESNASDEAERRKRSGQSAAAARITHQQSWVDQQIRVAMAKGDFDNLEGAGKPIAGLGEAHDPDWWLKKLVEREKISVLPPALQLRKDDAELEARLDAIGSEVDVRREVEDFNARVMKARYDPLPGPPLVTQPREIETEVVAWEERRQTRMAARARTRAEPSPSDGAVRRRWWRRPPR